MQTKLNKYLKKDFKQLKESTKTSYLSIINNHITPFITTTKEEKINNTFITSFINNINKKDLSLKTKRKIINVFPLIYQPYTKLNIVYLTNNILLQVINQQLIPTLSKQEIKKLINYLLKTDNKHAIGVLLAIFTGMRIGEICALRQLDIDYDNNLINVSSTVFRSNSKLNVTQPKTTTSNRLIPLNIILKDKLKPNKDNIFVVSNKKSPTDPRVLRQYFYNTLEILKINKYKFHDLRHTFATIAISKNFNVKAVSELSGHANVQTTLNLYVHPKLDEKRKYIDNIYK